MALEIRPLCDALGMEVVGAGFNGTATGGRGKSGR